MKYGQHCRRATKRTCDGVEFLRVRHGRGDGMSSKALWRNDDTVKESLSYLAATPG